MAKRSIAGQRKLQRHADECACPQADAETRRQQAALHQRQERRIGSRNQQIDGRMIEATQIHFVGVIGHMLYAAESASTASRPTT